MSRISLLSRSLVCILTVLGLALALAPAEARPEYQFGIGITPTSGPPGTVVTVSGGGWTPNSTGNLVFWDAQAGTPIGTFDANGNGAFSTTITVPAGASAGAHTIWACDRCGSRLLLIRPRWASATFTVILPPTPTPPPTATPVPPTECDATGLAGEVVIDFESYSSGENLRGTTTEEGVRFIGEEDLFVLGPAVAAHSGNHALISGMMMEFGSAGKAMRIGFDWLQDFVGMYVGLNEQMWATGPFTATLTAFRLDCARDATTGEESCVRAVAGTDSVTIGPEPADIRECLSVSASGIFEVTLDYDAGEPELIDDLTLRGPEVPVPVPGDNVPPIVSISDPSEGETFAAGPIRLQGTVQEDFELDRLLHYEIASGPTGEINATGFAPSYAFAIDFSEEGLTPNALNTVTVIARDTAGNEGRDSVSFYFTPPPTPTPTPTLDIIVEAMEITQVIQCLHDIGCEDNSLPLYMYKPTLVRAYLRTEGARREVPAVGGELCYGLSWGSEFSPVECIDSQNRISVTGTDDPVRDYRGDIGRTLNFYIPLAWTGMRDTRLTFRVIVNPGGETAPESRYDNNELFERAMFIRGHRLNVVVVRTNIDGERIRQDQVGDGLLWLLRYTPTSNIHIYGHSVDPVDGSWDLTTKEGWSGLLQRLDWIRFWTAEGFSSPRYHALVDPDTNHRSTGMGWVPGDNGRWLGRSSASVWATLYGLGDNVAHELGHNHGLHHSPGNCGEANVDDEYPQYVDPYSWTAYPRVSIGTWGIDLHQGPPYLYSPWTTPDLMSYCGQEAGTPYTNPVWMSIYTYRWMGNAINRTGERDGSGVRAVLFRADSQPEVLVGSGIVTPDSVVFDPPAFYRVALPEDEGLTPDDGQYTVELRTAGGEVLATRRFDPQPDEDSWQRTDGQFFLVVPWVEGTQQIAFLHGETPIGSLSVSANAPTVTLLEPDGGERWAETGTETVRWEASDIDGDALSAIVQYSADDGTTWTAVALQVGEGRAEIAVDALAGSQAARMRVCVSDGVNTTCDASDEVFTVPAKAPAVYLVSPEDGQVFPDGEMVVMQGFATDAEDGSIADGSAYVWSSDRDGGLGNGQSQFGLPLSAGRHQITLTVTDSDGQSGSASVSIVVGSEEAGQGQPGGGPWTPPRWIGGALIGLAVVLGAGLTVLLFRGRRARRG